MMNGEWCRIGGISKSSVSIPHASLVRWRTQSIRMPSRGTSKPSLKTFGGRRSAPGVPRTRLAAEIDRRAGEAGLCQPVLLEVNIGGEPGKAGFLPSAVPDALAALDGMPNLSVRGLMAIPPPGSEPEAARPYFRRVSELARSVARPGFRRIRMDHTSMGMSQDYEIAVEEGATMVRVGTAIFGARPAPVAT